MVTPQSSDPASRSRGRLPPVEGSFPWVVLAFAAVLVLFLGAWEREVSGTAGFYAALSRQIADTGRWNPLFHGPVPYVLKPPLQLWLAAALMKVLGPTSFAATLFPRLLGMGCVALVAALGSTLYGRTAGFFAAAVLLANGTFLENATTFRMESGLLFGFLLALWAYFSPEGRWRPPVFFCAVSFAVLSKGAPGLLPLPLALLHAAFARRLAWPWHPRAHPWALGALLLLAPASWFLDQYLRFGTWFVEELAADYTRTELTGFGQRLRHGLDVYAAVPFVRWLPFSPLMAWGLGRAAREALGWEPGTHPRLRALGGSFTVFLLVLLAALVGKGTHRVRYLALLLPLLTLLGGREMSLLAGGRLRSSWVAGLAVALAAVCLGLAVGRPPLTRNDGAAGLRLVRRLVDEELGPAAVPVPVLERTQRPVGPYGRQETARDWAYFYLGRRVRPVRTSDLTNADSRVRLCLLPRELWEAPPAGLPLRILVETGAMRLVEVTADPGAR